MRTAAVGHQCPECVAEGRRSTRPARTVFGGTRAGTHGYVTGTLIGLNVLMLIIDLVLSNAGGPNGGGGLGSLLGGNITKLQIWGGLLGGATRVPASDGVSPDTIVLGVANGEYYRLLTSMFLHAGVFHLLMNMWALWVLGRNLEAALGPIRFLAVYLLSGLGGSVAVYWFSPPNSPTVGASGAIFGLFAAFFLILRRLGRDTSSIIPVLIINLVITFAVPSISIAGHLGGLVSGAIVGGTIAYAPQKNRSVIQVGVCAVFAVALVALTLARTAALQAPYS